LTGFNGSILSGLLGSRLEGTCNQARIRGSVCGLRPTVVIVTIAVASVLVRATVQRSCGCGGICAGGGVRARGGCRCRSRAAILLCTLPVGGALVGHGSSSGGAGAVGTGVGAASLTALPSLAVISFPRVSFMSMTDPGCFCARLLFTSLIS